MALGVLQTGIVLLSERAVNRWLARETPWTVVVLINGMIMSIYLWHMTAAIAAVLIAQGLGGPREIWPARSQGMIVDIGDCAAPATGPRSSCPVRAHLAYSIENCIYGTQDFSVFVER